MATRKKTVENEVIKDVKATREDIEAAVIWLAEHTDTVPCMVGPTASGKTRLASKIAADRGAELLTILLQQDTPEEIAGFQAPIGERLVSLHPYWFNRAQGVLNNGGKVVLFFDELGLSHEATRGAMYTFFRDREIRGSHLTCAHNSTEACRDCLIVIAGMNPAELAPAMETRIAKIHVPADRDHMLSLAKTSLAKRIAMAAPIEGKHAHTSNEAPASPVVYTLAQQAVVNEFDRTFWGMSEAARNIIATAVVPAAVIEEVLRADTLTTPSIDAQIADPSLIPTITAALDIPAAVANIKALWEALPHVDFEKEAIPVMAQIQLATSVDEDYAQAVFDMDISQEVKTWWENLNPTDSAQKIADYFTKEGLLNFDPDNPRGILMDNYLMQAPPEDNEMTHLMSPEALAKWKKKYNVK